MKPQNKYTCSEAVARRPATLLKKKPWHRCFHVNFTKFLRTHFLTEHLRWLVLHVSILTN